MLSTVSRHVRNNVIGYLALFVAFGGTSYAAVQIPGDSVGTAQLRNGAVTATKVKSHSLLASDFAGGQLQPGPQGARGPIGPIGPIGPQGTPGATGTQGPAGPQGTAGHNGAQGADGAQGPQGPVGPQGPKGDSGTAHTSIAQNWAIVAPGQDVSVSVTCPTGTTVTGGGFSDAAFLQVELSAPDPDSNAWDLEVKNPSSTTSVQAFVQAVCAS